MKQREQEREAGLTVKLTEKLDGKRDESLLEVISGERIGIGHGKLSS
jgi:hypothetical protein